MTDAKISALPSRPIFERAPLRLKACKHGTMLYYANDIYIGRSLDLYGEFCEREIKLFQQLIRPGMTVIDAGANIGVHTLYFAKAAGASGSVVAIEPQRAIFHVLCANIALNQLMNVQAIHAALGSAAGTARVPQIDYTKGANFGGLELGGSTQGEAVSVITVDSLALDRCDFIKVDVEGMEQDVLAGAEQTLANYGPILYAENDRPDKSAALIKWLLERNYRLYWHLPPLFNPANYFGRADNVFGATVSANMFCLPASKNIAVENFRQITSPEDTWQV